MIRNTPPADLNLQQRMDLHRHNWQMVAHLRQIQASSDATARYLLATHERELLAQVPYTLLSEVYGWLAPD